MSSDDGRQPRILIGVTVAQSLVHHEGLPGRLVREGWHVTVVSSPGPKLDELRSDGIDVIPVRMRRDPSPLYDLFSLVSWFVVIRRVRPDFVMIGTPKASLLGLFAARCLSVRNRVYVLHGLRLETANGWFRSILVFLERFTIRNSSCVLAVSPSLQKRARELSLTGKTHIQVLGEGSVNGIVVPSEGEYRAAIKSRYECLDVPLLGYVGRVNVDKGFADLLDALEALNAQGVPMRSAVVGASEGVRGMELLHRYRTLPGAHDFRGPVTDVGPHYAEMDILCLPSYREGLGMVVLEAAAWGVPAVVSDATGVRDSIVDGVTGLRYPVGDVDALVGALRKFLTDAKRMRTMGRSARERATRDFERRLVQDRLVTFLGDLVNA